jgi:adenylosuccinate lyase
MDELPFMATEELIVRAVRAGGNRQDAHERIRRYSIDAARAIKDGAEQNDLLDRIAADDTFGITRAELEQAMDPKRFVGRAPQQVDEFLEEVVEPLLAGASAEVTLEEMRVCTSLARALFHFHSSAAGRSARCSPWMRSGCCSWPATG